MPTSKYRSIKNQFHNYPDQHELELHEESHRFNLEVLEGKIKVNYTYMFTHNGFDCLAYELQSGDILVFGTIYHQPLGHLDRLGNWISKRKAPVIMGYPINEKQIVSILQEMRSSHLKKVELSLTQRTRKNIFLFGLTANLGHHIWNEQSGMDTLMSFEPLPPNTCIFFGQYDYFAHADYMKKYHPELKIVNIPELQRLSYPIITRNALLKSAELVFPEQTKIRLKSWIEENTTAPGSAPASTPIIAIQIRRHQRIWVNEMEGILSLIRTLHDDYPQMQFLIDGFSRHDKLDESTEKWIEIENNFFKTVRDALPAAVKLKSLIGETLINKSKWILQADLVLGPIGSGGVFSGWLLNRPVISYGPPTYYDWVTQDSLSVVENPRSDWLFLDKSKIDLAANGVDYIFDSTELLPLIRQIIHRI